MIILETLDCFSQLLISRLGKCAGELVEFSPVAVAIRDNGPGDARKFWMAERWPVKGRVLTKSFRCSRLFSRAFLAFVR